MTRHCILVCSWLLYTGVCSRFAQSFTATQPSIHNPHSHPHLYQCLFTIHTVIYSYTGICQCSRSIVIHALHQCLSTIDSQRHSCLFTTHATIHSHTSVCSQSTQSSTDTQTSVHNPHSRLQLHRNRHTN